MTCRSKLRGSSNELNLNIRTKLNPFWVVASLALHGTVWSRWWVYNPIIIKPSPLMARQILSLEMYWIFSTIASIFSSGNHGQNQMWLSLLIRTEFTKFLGGWRKGRALVQTILVAASSKAVQSHCLTYLPLYSISHFIYIGSLIFGKSQWLCLCLRTKDPNHLMILDQWPSLPLLWKLLKKWSNRRF